MNLLLLDTWVLSTYSTFGSRQRFLDFIARRNLVPLVNALHLVELFNPGWQNAPGAERGDRVAELLAAAGAAIVDPKEVARAEFLSYPISLPTLPLQLIFTDIAPGVRHEALLRFLRADALYLAQGKDIREWAATHQHTKETWAADRHEILAAAIREGQVAGESGVYSFVSAATRAAFLNSLDCRLLGWLTPQEREALGEQIIPLFLGDTAKLPAVRMSSLLFAHLLAYPIACLSSLGL